jgi:uncharacterized protein (DUF58 family)
MLDSELLAKIRQIQIYTSHAVNAAFAGQYESVFRGRGMQFEEVREYIPGDDIRDIDWNVTARTGRAYIKRFVEERELTIILAVDMSGSGDFGSGERSKNELAAELCAVLAFAAIRSNDKVGLLIFTDQVEMFVPPKKGSSHVLRIIRELLGFKKQGVKTNIKAALEHLARTNKKKAVIFMVSDFMATGYLRDMTLLGQKHDLIAVEVHDPAEAKLPAAGIIELKDAETGRRIFADTSSRRFRKSYEAAAAKRRSELLSGFRSAGIDCITVQTDKPYIHDIVKFFHIRHSRR